MFSSQDKDYVSLQPGDVMFMFQSGMTLVPRASLQVDTSCPPQYHDILVQAIQRGWITPVAHIQGKEATWARLK
jgi:hypothetical protein